MKKITQPHFADEKNNIFTESINYFDTGSKSIWGEGDETTKKFIQDISIKGRWLNLAAGDGRYASQLLEKVDSLVATDIDEGALSKLWHTTSLALRPKLSLQTADITQAFPFERDSFEGVFNTGTLHLFHPSCLKGILRDMDRVTKVGGHILLDFATDIKRVLPDGTLRKRTGEVGYTMESAINLIKNNFPNYSIQLIRSKVPEEQVTIGNTHYTFSCKFFILYAEKLS